MKTVNLAELAHAVKDEDLRNALLTHLSREEASAFEEYTSEYKERERVVDKKDS